MPPNKKDSQLKRKLDMDDIHTTCKKRKINHDNTKYNYRLRSHKILDSDEELKEYNHAPIMKRTISATDLNNDDYSSSTEYFEEDDSDISSQYTSDTTEDTDDCRETTHSAKCVNENKKTTKQNIPTNSELKKILMLCLINELQNMSISESLNDDDDYDEDDDDAEDYDDDDAEDYDDDDTEDVDSYISSEDETESGDVSIHTTEVNKCKKKNTIIFEKLLAGSSDEDSTAYFKALDIKTQNDYIQKLRPLQELITLKKPYNLTILDMQHCITKNKLAALTRLNALNELEEAGGEEYSK